MKKTFISLSVLAAAIFFASCGGGGGFESDVRKMAELRCKAQKLGEKAGTGDEAAKKELEGMQKETMEMATKMMEKYKDKQDDKAMSEKADKIMDEVMAKCK
jgi:hypothetical protein